MSEPRNTPLESPDSPLPRFREEVLSRGTFSEDWFTQHVSTWEPILRTLDGRVARVLEIGSFEGLSTCYLLWRLPDVRVTCVDTFAGSPEHRDAGIDVSDLEGAFDRNVALIDSSRVRKLVGDSRRLLLDLDAAGDVFDLVYVDGSHHALDVIVDAALAWRILKRGGVLVFDDYQWPEHADEPLLRPDTGIDAFLAIVEGRYELVFSRYQLALRKSA